METVGRVHFARRDLWSRVDPDMHFRVLLGCRGLGFSAFGSGSKAWGLNRDPAWCPGCSFVAYGCRVAQSEP